MNQLQRAARTRQRRFGVLCLLAYVTLSWAIRLDMGRGDERSTQIASVVYPLDTFSMYAQVPGREMSYLLTRDAEGAVHQVTDFRSFDCNEPVRASASRCPERRTIHYLYEDFLRYIESHAGAGATEVEILLRTWHGRPGAAAMQASDCVITRCRVSR